MGVAGGLLGGLVLISQLTFALDNDTNYQFHARVGLLDASYAGSGLGRRTFAVPTTADLELEVFTARDESFHLRSMMAMELNTDRVDYTYAGFGKAYYLLGRGKSDIRSEKDISIKTIPTTRYYWGWNVGVAQVLVVPYGLVLASYSTTLDISLDAGVIHQVSENLGIELRTGVGTGYGFSAVTVTGVTFQALVGVTYSM